MAITGFPVARMIGAAAWDPVTATKYSALP
jgi:hypothetical protein